MTYLENYILENLDDEDGEECTFTVYTRSIKERQLVHDILEALTQGHQDPWHPKVSISPLEMCTKIKAAVVHICPELKGE